MYKKGVKMVISRQTANQSPTSLIVAKIVLFVISLTRLLIGPTERVVAHRVAQTVTFVACFATNTRGIGADGAGSSEGCTRICSVVAVVARVDNGYMRYLGVTFSSLF